MLSGEGLSSTNLFLSETALDSKRPGHASDQLPRPMAEAVQFCATHSDQFVATARSKALRAMIAKADELSAQEAALKATLTQRRRSVLEKKRLLLFKDSLLQAGSPDVELPGDMASELTGRAKFSCKASRAQATQTLTKVYDATLKAREKGFLKGPIPEEDIPTGSTLTRRFGVVQKEKVRPIDDYKASLVNSAVTQVEVVTLHGVDHIASMGASFLRACASAKKQANVVAKCSDLASAYKQIPLSEEACCLDSYIVVYNPTTGTPEVYQQAVIPFGSVASVTAFARCAMGIWLIGSSLLKLIWSSYFDDFLTLTTESLSRHAEICISTLFRLLGWDLSEDKLVPYSHCCKVGRTIPP